MTYKMVLIVRTDLKMGKGKMLAQGAHAAVEAALSAKKEILDKWKSTGAKKIALKVNSERELLELSKESKKQKIQTTLIKDAGLTQVAPGTITALALGPDLTSKIDKICGRLKLF